jgi:type IV fimbrial biogenesis protein FimT
MTVSRKRAAISGKEAGFTLIELIVTLVVAGIVLAIAIPGFQPLIRSNLASTQAGDFMTFLNLARSEAIMRNQSITMCRSADGASCSSSGSWDQGWIVFVDPDGDSVVDAGETVLRVREAFKGNASISAGSEVAAAITFSGTGESAVGTVAAEAERTVALSSGGRTYSIVVSATGLVKAK